jgi:glycine/D-amino acid oxidase-like deaminating enzyme
MCSGSDRVDKAATFAVSLWQSPRPSRARGAPMTVIYCYWLKPPARATNPTLEGNVTVDVAVIGGGYTTGTAYHLKAADPSLDVAILEAETTATAPAAARRLRDDLLARPVGLMKLCTAKSGSRGDFMVGAIDSLESMIADNGIDCDYERSGFLRVATTQSYAGRIRKEVEFFQSLGIGGFEWVPPEWIAARIRSTPFHGGCWEPGCGSLNPMKWVEGLRGLALGKGAHLHENTRVMSVKRQSGRYVLKTAGGTVSADKVVYATNGYTHLLPGMRSKQTRIRISSSPDPLTPDQLEALGWKGRETIEDGRSFMHFYRLTRDGRILAGGGPGHVPFNGGMNHDSSPKAWAHLEQFIGETFPALRGIRIAHRWGGAFSVTANLTPQIGTMDGGGAVYSIGCTGHGVAMTQMNGRIIRDLVLERKTELTDCGSSTSVCNAARAHSCRWRQDPCDSHGGRRLVVRPRPSPGKYMAPEKIAVIAPHARHPGRRAGRGGFEVTALVREPWSAPGGFCPRR